MNLSNDLRRGRNCVFLMHVHSLWGDSLWSPSYFAGACDGASLEIIRQYIEQQNSPAI
ncbi:MAG: transposase [Verrucomicrobia bacterium]|nr:transposase [Verrucomicrobiota bacterium]